MFREDGSMYEFGTGYDKSVFTFGTAVAALAVIASFVFAMGDVVSSRGGGYALTKTRSTPMMFSPPPPPPSTTSSHSAPSSRSTYMGGRHSGYLNNLDPFDLDAPRF